MRSFLPRQTRDKHREGTQNRYGFPIASAERRKHTAMAETMQSIFCGELVAASLQVLGLMRTEGITAHDFVPTDFSHDEYERGLFDESLAPAKRGEKRKPTGWLFHQFKLCISPEWLGKSSGFL